MSLASRRFASPDEPFACHARAHQSSPASVSKRPKQANPKGTMTECVKGGGQPTSQPPRYEARARFYPAASPSAVLNIRISEPWGPWTGIGRLGRGHKSVVIPSPHSQPPRSDRYLVFDSTAATFFGPGRRQDCRMGVQSGTRPYGSQKRSPGQLIHTAGAHSCGCRCFCEVRERKKAVSAVACREQEGDRLADLRWRAAKRECKR